MSFERKPIRSTYDAIIDVFPNEGIATHAYAIAKFTMAIEQGECKLTKPIPLLHDFRCPDNKPLLHPGTDFWMDKQATDVVVQGSAWAPKGKPCNAMNVIVEFGAIKKHLHVFGRREIHWQASGNVKIGSPEPFTEIPIVYENAYGGKDLRIPVNENSAKLMLVVLQVDHPGWYPRNPFGKGYFVYPEPVAGAEMPNLEDPNDRLTPERLIVRDPKNWFRQPLPWAYEWMHPIMFPRYLYSGLNAEAWFPAPDNEQLTEINRGFLPNGYRSIFQQQGEMDIRFCHGASYGLSLSQVIGDELIYIEGMHPEHPSIRFQLPRLAPSFVFRVDGKPYPTPPRIHSIVIQPMEKQLSMVFAAKLELPRRFILGVHKHIPVEVEIAGDRPLAYEAPVPIREEVAKGMAGINLNGA